MLIFKYHWIVLLVLSYALVFQANADVKGSLEYNFGFHMDDHTSSLSDSIFELEWSREWNAWSLDALGRARYETELESTYYQEVELREFTVGYRGSNINLLMGRQQVVWGKVDGFRLLDAVNPIDLREFILDDFSDSRIPLWMFNAEVIDEENQLQILVIPDLTFNRLASAGSEFHISPDITDIVTTYYATESPSSIPENWEYGFRWSRQFDLWDLSVNYLYSWSDNPVYFYNLIPGPQLEVYPRIVRRRILGMSGDRPIGPLIFRFEFMLSPDEYRNVTLPAPGIGELQSLNQLKLAMGLDWIVDGWLIGGQYFQDAIIESDVQLVNDDVQKRYISFLAQKKYLNDKLNLQLFSMYGVEDKDSWVSPKIGYQFMNNYEFQFSVDVFNGDAKGLFGRFSNNDRAVILVKYYF